jgi:hypothetical protein
LTEELHKFTENNMINQMNSKYNKILISGGDSFVYGLDMLDCNSSNNYAPSNSTWPALLANHMQRDYICAAYPGSSNSSISRRTILTCEKYKNQDIFLVVSWSFLNRFEFKFTTQFATITDKSDLEGISLSLCKDWVSFNIRDLYGSTDLMKKYIEPDIMKFLKDYYKFVGSDDVYEYYMTLKDIVYLQNYLKLKNIPYVFTSASAFYRKNIDDENIQCLLDQIDFNNWFFFPELTGFLDWAYKNNYPKRDEHPSEEAHHDAFELIRNYLDSKNIKTIQTNS